MAQATPTTTDLGGFGALVTRRVNVQGLAFINIFVGDAGGTNGGPTPANRGTGGGGGGSGHLNASGVRPACGLVASSGSSQEVAEEE